MNLSQAPDNILKVTDENCYECWKSFQGSQWIVSLNWYKNLSKDVKQMKLVDFICGIWTIATNINTLKNSPELKELVMKFSRKSQILSQLREFAEDAELKETLQQGLFNLRKYLEYSCEKQIKIPHLQQFYEPFLLSEDVADYVQLYSFTLHYAVSNSEQTEYLKSQLICDYFSSLKCAPFYSSYIMQLVPDKSVLSSLTRIDFSSYWKVAVEVKHNNDDLQLEHQSSFLTTITWLEMFKKISSYPCLFLEALKSILSDEYLIVYGVSPVRMVFMLKLLQAENFIFSRDNSALELFLCWIKEKLQTSRIFQFQSDCLWQFWNGKDCKISNITSPTTMQSWILYIWLELLLLESTSQDIIDKILLLMEQQFDQYENYFMLNQLQNLSLTLISKGNIIERNKFGRVGFSLMQMVNTKLYELNWIYTYDAFSTSNFARKSSQYLVERFSVVIVPSSSTLLGNYSQTLELTYIFPVHVICSKILGFALHVYENEKLTGLASTQIVIHINQNLKLLLSTWIKLIEMQEEFQHHSSDIASKFSSESLHKYGFGLSIEYDPGFNEMTFAEWKQKHGRNSPLFPATMENEEEVQQIKSPTVVNKAAFMWRWPASSYQLLWSETLPHRNDSPELSYSPTTLLQLCWERALVTIFYIVEVQYFHVSNAGHKSIGEEICRSILLKLLRILAQVYTCRSLIQNLTHIVKQQQLQRRKKVAVSPILSTTHNSVKLIETEFVEQQNDFILNEIYSNMLKIPSTVWDTAILTLIPSRSIKDKEALGKFPILSLTSGGTMLLVNYLQYNQLYDTVNADESKDDTPFSTLLQSSFFHIFDLILQAAPEKVDVPQIPSVLGKWFFQKSPDIQERLCEFIGCIPVLLVLTIILRYREEQYDEIFEYIQHYSCATDSKSSVLFEEDDESLRVDATTNEEAIHDSIWQCVGEKLGKDDIKTLILVLYAMFSSLLYELRSNIACKQEVIAEYLTCLAKCFSKNYRLAKNILKFVNNFNPDSRNENYADSLYREYSMNLFFQTIDDMFIQSCSPTEQIINVFLAVLSMQHDSKLLLGGWNIVEALKSTSVCASDINSQTKLNLEKFSFHVLQTVYTESVSLPSKSFCELQFVKPDKCKQDAKHDGSISSSNQDAKKLFSRSFMTIPFSICATLFGSTEDTQFFQSVLKTMPVYEIEPKSLDSIFKDMKELLEFFLYPNDESSPSVYQSPISIHNVDDERLSEWWFIRSAWLCWWRTNIIRIPDNIIPLCNGMGYAIYHVVDCLYFQMQNYEKLQKESISPTKLSPIRNPNSARNSNANTPTSVASMKSIGGKTKNGLPSPAEFFAAKGALLKSDGKQTMKSNNNPFSSLLLTPESMIKSNHARKQTSSLSVNDNGISEAIAAALPSRKRQYKLSLGSFTKATQDWYLQIVFSLLPISLWSLLCSSNIPCNNNFINFVKLLIWIIHQFSNVFELLKHHSSNESSQTSTKRARKTTATIPSFASNQLSEFFQQHCSMLLQVVDIIVEMLDVLQDTWTSVYDFPTSEDDTDMIKERKDCVLHWMMALMISMQRFVGCTNTLIEHYFSVNTSVHAQYPTMTLNRSILKDIQKRIGLFTELIEMLAVLKTKKMRKKAVGQEAALEEDITRTDCNVQPTIILDDDDYDTDAEVCAPMSLSNTALSGKNLSIRLSYPRADELSESCKPLAWLDTAYDDYNGTNFVDIPTDVE